MNRVFVFRMRPDEAGKAAELIRKTIWKLRYYNKLAQRSEIEKYSSKKLKEKIGDDPDSVLLAKVEDEIIGFCVSTQDAYTIWLDWFGVAKKSRKRGVGKLLLRSLEGTVRARSGHKIWCDCRTTNTVSIRTLSSFGFKQIATIKKHWYGQDFILWHKYVPKRKK